jgi:hypothetical protein
MLLGQHDPRGPGILVVPRNSSVTPKDVVPELRFDVVDGMLPEGLQELHPFARLQVATRGATPWREHRHVLQASTLL